jgi:hypothetical protein
VATPGGPFKKISSLGVRILCTEHSGSLRDTAWISLLQCSSSTSVELLPLLHKDGRDQLTNSTIQACNWMLEHYSGTLNCKTGLPAQKRTEPSLLSSFSQHLLKSCSPLSSCIYIHWKGFVEDNTVLQCSQCQPLLQNISDSYMNL